jgi:hypothetical protein
MYKPNLNNKDLFDDNNIYLNTIIITLFIILSNLELGKFNNCT